MNYTALTKIFQRVFHIWFQRITKSDVEYDDDWEQDLGSTSSSGR